jgi:hypothetical protein
MNARHIGLDGSTVTFDADLDLSMPAVSVLDVRVGDWTFEFTAGGPDLGRWAAEDVSKISLQESYSLHGGTLRIGHGSAVGADGAVTPTLAGVWVGRGSSLIVMYPRSDDSGELLNLIASARLVEVGPSAIRMAKLPAGGTVDREPSVAKRIPGFGMIETFPVTRQTVKKIPSWGGTAVRGGEIFRGDSNGAPYYLFASNTAIAVVMPQAGVPIDQVAQDLETLSITWSSAG